MGVSENVFKRGGQWKKAEGVGKVGVAGEVRALAVLTTNLLGRKDDRSVKDPSGSWAVRINQSKV